MKQITILAMLLIGSAGLLFALQARMMQSPTEGTTEIIDVVPTSPAPLAVSEHTGICWGRSTVVALANAWRCGVTDGPTRGAVYDPCFSQADEMYAICGVDPATDNPGFLLALAAPLFMPLLDQQTPQVWQLSLADGSTCTVLTPPVLHVAGQPLRYACDDNTYILGELTSGSSWRARKVKVAQASSGYDVAQETMVAVVTIWRVALPDELISIADPALLDGLYPVEGQSVRLRGGRFDNKMDAVGFSRSIYWLEFRGSTLRRADGDLNDDALQDTVVLLTTDGGGSGTFTYLAAMLNVDGTPINAATVFLGDRVDIQELTIVNAAIEVQLLTRGPDDSACCPTQQEVRTYRLVGEELVY